MRYLQFLAAGLLVITLFTVTVLSNVNCPPFVDCTPTGTFLNNTLQDTCPASLEYLFAITNLGKQSHYNVSWPNGRFDGLTASGTGQCGINQPCGLFAQRGHTTCWPDFYTPSANSNGTFSILVENKVVLRENHE